MPLISTMNVTTIFTLKISYTTDPYTGEQKNG